MNNKAIDKALNDFFKEFNKFNETLSSAKAEYDVICTKIDAVKSEVKDQAKEGKILSLLKGKTNNLSKLLAEKEIICLQIQALEEIQKENKTEVINKACIYIDKVKEEQDKIRAEYSSKIKEAEEMEKKARELKQRYNYNMSSGICNRMNEEVKRNLKDVLNTRDLSWNSNINDIKNKLING